jgi:hypothetical protein
MTTKQIIYIGLLSFLFGCTNNLPETKTEIPKVSGDSILTMTSEASNLSSSYALEDLSPEIKQDITRKLKDAELLIIKYNGSLPKIKYDSKVLDDVFQKWIVSDDKSKESPEYVIDALGAAFGEDIVNSLNCEWKVLTDNYGTDLTVINKEFEITSFPFSSAEKAYNENKVGAFQSIKLILKKNIQEAKDNPDVKKR